MGKRKNNDEQLSLFENSEPGIKPISETKEPSVLEFMRARLEYGPDMTPEEYRRWIKILIHHSLRRSMD